MDTSKLEALGFTHAEARVYLTLLSLGSVKVGRIIEKTGLQSSTIHNTINTLKDKGVITYILKGKIKVYQAVEPKIVLSQCQERLKQFEAEIPNLEILRDEEIVTAEVFTGWKAIENMLNQVLADTKKGDYYYFYSVDVPGKTEEIMKFFARRDKKRREHGLIVKGLARKKLKPWFKERKDAEMKYTASPIPINMTVCAGKLILYNWGAKPTGILIKSNQLVDKQKAFFEALWDRS
ncbi:MAG: TrmB family transcriptional regulator [Candidatus Nanoarchaeia archaeon]